jgi:hypothetical protein
MIRFTQVKKSLRISLNLFGLAALTIAGFELWIRYAPSANRDRLRTALNLVQLPASIDHVRCPPSSYPTDLVINCEFRYEPDELGAILKGWDWKTHDRTRFEVLPLPKDFAHGGEITLTLDPGSKAGRVVFYQE